MKATVVRGALAALAGVALLAVFLLGGESIMQWLMPALRRSFELFGPEFEVLSFGIDREKADRVLRVTVKLNQTVVIGERVLVPDPRGTANASTLLLQGLQGPFVAAWVALAWPLRAGAAELALRVLCVLPAMLLLVLIDAPMMLASTLWQLIADHLAPGATTPLLVARDIARGGVRLGLGAAAGAAAVIAALWLLTRVRRGR